MNFQARRNSARAGFTLLELAIAAVVFSILLAAMGRAVITGSAAFDEGSQSAVIDANAQRLLDRIADELRGAQLGSITPVPLAPIGSSTITFSRGAGYVGGAVVSGPTETIRMALDPGEKANGKDDNGNGLVDEQQVELVPDVTQPGNVVVLGKFVRKLARGELANGKDDNGNGLNDEGGLSFESDGAATITIRLTLETPTRGGKSVMRSLETAVRIRNN